MIDHASPFQNKRLDSGSPLWMLTYCEGPDEPYRTRRVFDMFSPCCITASRLSPSHCVSTLPAMKSGWATNPRRRLILVLKPSILESAKIRWVFLTDALQVDAVTIILANRLSKLDPATSAGPETLK